MLWTLTFKKTIEKSRCTSGAAEAAAFVPRRPVPVPSERAGLLRRLSARSRSAAGRRKGNQSYQDAAATPPSSQPKLSLLRLVKITPAASGSSEKMKIVKTNKQTKNVEVTEVAAIFR